MLKEFNEQAFLKTAKQVIYEQVNFPKGFGDFLESLYIEGLTFEKPARQICSTGYNWIDELTKGGIKLDTSDYPIANKSIGQLSISGQPDELMIIQNMLSRHGINFDNNSSSDIDVDFEYHHELNPKLWTLLGTGQYELQSKVLRALLKAAHAFYLFLELPRLDVIDIVITGSNANYNWTEMSDIDLHIIIDMKYAKKKYGKVVEKYLSAQKKVWNELRDINIFNIPVEFYIQDRTEQHFSTGVYSIQNQMWVIKPLHSVPPVNDTLIELKATCLINRINEIINNCNKPATLNLILEKLRKMRKAGLEENGEFSTENLIFKTLRDQGIIQDVMDKYNDLVDEEYSLTNSPDKQYWEILFI